MFDATELLPGAYYLKAPRSHDERGSFVKTFAASALVHLGIHFGLHEEFHSVSKRNVIRGMHFQRSPHAHDKIVYCPVGAVLDVLLDLRKGDGFGRVASVRLTPDEPAVLYIPRGIAHGFKALADDTLMVYKTNREYSAPHDAGVRWDSFGFDWQCPNPILSQRDRLHPGLQAP